VRDQKIETLNRIAVDETEREKVRRTLLNSSLVVEAGAGTGKTSLLIDRLLSLIGQFEITELAAITFTEKAAAELKERLRQELERQVVSKTVQLTPDPKYLRALNDIDRARISTIHAFASSIISEHPFEVGIEPSYRHMNDTEEHDLLMQVLADQMAEPDGDRDATISLFLLLGGGFSQFGELLRQINRQRDLLPYFQASTALREPAEWFHDLRDTTIRLAETAERYCNNPADPGRLQIERLADLCPSADKPTDEQAYNWLIEAANLSRTAGNRDNWDHPDTARRQKEQIAGLKSDASDIYEQTKTAVLEKLIVWLSQVIDSAQEKKLRNNLLTFQDQLIIADRLLEFPDVLSSLRRRCNRLLIDEFQDTDPLQVEIALKLAAAGPVSGDIRALRPEAGKICLVGDPKQSIYRFRRADHRIYISATEQVRSFGEKIIISQNFRSAPGIIDFVNGFFESIWEAETGDGSSYEPLVADPKRLDPHPAPPVTVIHRGADDPDPIENIAGARRLEAGIIARVINAAVNLEKWRTAKTQPDGSLRFEPVDYGDIVILMPRTTDIDIYADALSSAAIPYDIERGRALFQRQIVRDLYHCLAAIDNPADRLAVVGALRSSFFGLSDVELTQWHNLTKGGMDYRDKSIVAPAETEAALDILRRLHAQRYGLGADRLIERLYESTDIVPALLSDGLTAMDLKSLQSVLESARRFEVDCREGLRGFRRNLLKQLEEDGRENNTAVAGDADHVRIMTVHGAKGLEFPVVILANLNVDHEKREKIIPDRINRRLEVELGRMNDGFRTSRFDEAAKNEALAKKAEAVRLFYVALTRARDHLVLPCIYAKSPKGYSRWLNELITASGAFAGRAETHCRLLAERELPDVDRAGVTGKETSFDATHVGLARADWQRERETRLKDAVGKLPRVVAPSRHGYHAEDESESVLPGEAVDDAVSLGSALHLYMALTEPTTTFSDTLAEYVAGQAGIARRELDSPVKNCLNSDLWREALSGRRIWREAPICVKTDGGMLRGAIDLMWEDRKGDIHIADWKSGEFIPERHRRQVLEYARAVEQATGRKVETARLFFAATGQQTGV